MLKFTMRGIAYSLALCVPLVQSQNTTIPLPAGYNLSDGLPVANPRQTIPNLAPGYNFSIRQDDWDEYNTKAYANQMAVLEQRQSGCTSRNVIIRKEW
jgi:hypothetical protein